MSNAIVESFAELAREKGIDRDLLTNIVEETFKAMVRKKYGLEANFDVVMNMEKGDIEIYVERKVVEKVENPATEITLEAAKKIDKDLEVGEDCVEIVNLGKDIGRRLVINVKQQLNQRIREVERDNIFSQYSEVIGEVIVGEIYQIRRGDVYVMHNKTELLLPRSEQIPRERYKKGDTLRALVKDVQRGSSGMPAVILSRTSERFLAKLLETEIPEIFDGLIEIKGVARDPGERAKVAVLSLDDRIDAVGACVGMKGVRIHSIVRELANENIDIIPFQEDPSAYITRSLAPAKLRSIELDTENKIATVLVDDDQVPLAIGRNGQNVRLATKLTGYTINLVKEEREVVDIDITEFTEEVGADVVQALSAAGITTAKEFLGAGMEKLLAIEGLTEQKIVEAKEFMLAEFEDDDDSGQYVPTKGAAAEEKEEVKEEVKEVPSGEEK